MLSFILIAALIGVILWAVTTYLPMDASYKKLLVILVCIALIIWFLTLIGVVPANLNAPMPRI